MIDVQMRGRLIEEQYFGRLGKGRREKNALFFSAAQGAELPVAEFRGPRLLEGLFYGCPVLSRFVKTRAMRHASHVNDVLRREWEVFAALLQDDGNSTGELAAALNRNEIDIVSSPIGAVALARLLMRNADNTLNNKMTKEVFAAMWASEGDADSIIAAKGLKQISDSGEIEKIIDGVLASNAQQVADYRSGKEKAFNSLVGQVMKASKGKANPAQVNALLKQKLGAR